MTRPTAGTPSSPPPPDGAPSLVLDLQQHEPPGDPVCSARRCREHAVWALRWNNPRLHTPERRKTWLACEEHRGHLTEFLELRGFLRDTLPLEDLVDGRTSAAV
jgi:hypothetical protein